MSIRPDRPVSALMSWPVATIDHEATLVEVADALASDVVGALLVLREGGLVGIVSERDLVTHVAADADLSHLLAGEVMSDEVVTVQVDDTILEVARAMVDADVRHLPVLDGTLIAGMVSIRDVVAVLAGAVDDDDVMVVPSGTRFIVRGE